MPATRTFAPTSSAATSENSAYTENVSAKQHTPIADQEQADGEEQQSAEDERADESWTYVAFSLHVCDFMKARTDPVRRFARASRGVPRAMIRPWCSMTSSSPSRRALGMLWVTTDECRPVVLLHASGAAHRSRLP